VTDTTPPPNNSREFRIIDRVLLVADNVVEPNSPEIPITKFKSEHTEERRDTIARANADEPAERSETVGSEATERAIDVQLRPGLEGG
jgi:hypothetical protein